MGYSAVAAAAAAVVASGALSPSPSPMAPPPIAPPAPMPTQDDAGILAAKRRQMAAQSNLSGRQSTILSQATTDKLGS